MAELTKNDLTQILEAILLKFDGEDYYKLPGLKIGYSHIKMANETLEFIKEHW